LIEFQEESIYVLQLQAGQFQLGILWRHPKCIVNFPHVGEDKVGEGRRRVTIHEHGMGGNLNEFKVLEPLL
jgi:hypothetical protein